MQSVGLLSDQLVVWNVRLPLLPSQEKAALDAAMKAWRTQRRSYCNLRGQKREESWTRTVIDNRSSPHELWRSVNTLLRRGRVSAGQATHYSDVVELAQWWYPLGTVHQLFVDKVAAVRTATADDPHGWRPFADLLIVSNCWCNLQRHCVTIDKVVSLIHRLSDNSCALDVLPKPQLKSVVVDQEILLQRLETSFGVGGLALEWFRSYLTNRVEHVCRGTSCLTARQIVWITTGISAGSTSVDTLHSTPDLPCGMWRIMVLSLTCMQMIPILMALVSLNLLGNYSMTCLHVWMKYQLECMSTGFNWTRQRPRLFGAQRHVDNSSHQ